MAKLFKTFLFLTQRQPSLARVGRRMANSAKRHSGKDEIWKSSPEHFVKNNMGSEYNPALAPLSWLFGVWESVEAVASYPTMDTIKYHEILEYRPTLQPLVEYISDTWHSVKKTKLHCEKGFIRLDPESPKLAFMVSHHFGATEISEGSIDNQSQSLSFESKSVSCMSFLKVNHPTKIIRKLELKGEELVSTVLMGTTKTPLQLHLQCRYRKKNNV